jgi:hypothetical protein
LHSLSHILTLLPKSCIGAYHLLKRLSTKNERNLRAFPNAFQLP